MNYERVEYPNFRLHLIGTKKFKTIHVRIALKRELKKEEITIRNVISDILLESGKNYPTVRDLQIAKEENYACSLSSSSFKSGAYAVLVYSLSFLNERYTEAGMNEKSISLLFDLIKNPNVEGKSFDDKTFSLVMNSYRDYLESLEENPNRIAGVRLDEEMGPDTPLAYHASGYMEDYEKITKENLYTYYQDVLKNDIMDIFVLGDIDFEWMKEFFSKNALRSETNGQSKTHFVTLPHRQEVNEVIEEYDFVQSKLEIGYKIKDMTEFEKKYVFHAFNFIFGGGNDSKLFQEVRENNSLCYAIHSNISYLYQMLVVHAGIDKDDYQKAVDLINQELKKIQNGDFSDDDLFEMKMIYVNTCKRLYDSPMDVIQNYMSHEYFDHDFIEKRITEILKVTKEDVINLANKIELDTIYLLKGVSNE